MLYISCFASFSVSLTLFLISSSLSLFSSFTRLFIVAHCRGMDVLTLRFDLLSHIRSARLVPPEECLLKSRKDCGFSTFSSLSDGPLADVAFSSYFTRGVSFFKEDNAPCNISILGQIFEFITVQHFLKYTYRVQKMILNVIHVCFYYTEKTKRIIINVLVKLI